MLKNYSMGIKISYRKPRVKIFTPDQILLICTILSNAIKVSLLLFLPKNMMSHWQIILTNFLISVFIFIILMILCRNDKVDLYGKIKKSYISSFRKWSLKSLLIQVLIFFPLVGIFDPFLFFKYFKNGSKKQRKIILSWILLIPSLICASQIWSVLIFLKQMLF